MRGGGVCGWLLVFFFLLAEVLVCTVMVLPIPLQMRCGFLMDLGNICSSAVVKTALITTFTIFFGLFLDSLQDAYRLQTELSHHQQVGFPMHDNANLLSRMFRAQRNTYLTGCKLFLMLLLYRFQNIFHEFQSERDIDIPISQTELKANVDHDPVLNQKFAEGAGKKPQRVEVLQKTS